VEVKELARNDEERESARLVKERGYGIVVSSTPGERVRKKISESSPQFKAYARDATLPNVLVVFDGLAFGHTDGYNIRVAMYGLEQLRIALPPIGTGSPYATGWSYGPKRKMTAQDNTSISSIAQLFATGPDPSQLMLSVYHNRFAKVPLNSALLARYGVPHFELKPDWQSGKTAQWRQVA